jgi:carbamoyl-phosphate synthase/aspartate carbamoyltransferase/dihydroorotase
MAIQRLPGLVDVHVHLRDPGGTHKEDLTSGTAAALAGGVTTVLAMPNTSPPLTDSEVFRAIRRRAAERILCDVGFFIGANKENADTAAGLAPWAAGLKLYLNETFGPLRMDDLPAVIAHFRHWPRGRVIALHAEGVGIIQAIGLSWLFDQRVHLCHISRRSEIVLIAAAKQRGAKVTCEVTPHHLFLTEADAAYLGPLAHVKPPLAGQQDVDALWAHLEVVDCIATDHAPHTLEEKQAEHPPPGLPGLESLLPLLLTAVAEGRLTLERLVELTVTNPRRVFGLAPQPETWVEVEIGPAWNLPREGWLTRCGWSPFAGMTVRGRVLRTTLRGVTTFDRGRVLAEPGFGRVLFG